MNISKILFTILVAFCIWFFLFVSTFSKSPEVKYFKNNFIVWYNDLNSKIINNVEVKNTFVHNVNNIDSVIVNIDNISDYSFSKNQFKLNSWLYFFNLLDLNNSYKIHWSGFQIQPLSPWSFYVDIKDVNDIKIYSVDSLLDFKLIDLKDNNIANELKIYPNIWIKFNPKRNSLVKNTDFLRTQLLVNFKYLQTKIFVNGEFNIKWFSNYFNYYSQDSLNFLNSALSYNYKKFNDFIKTWKLINNYSVWGLNYIKSYYFLFLNDNKKIVYLKNNIIYNLNLIANDNKKYQPLKNDLFNDLSLLKELSIDEYNNFRTILDYYYLMSLYNKAYNNAQLSIIIYDLLKDYNNWSKVLNSSFYLNRMFTYFNKNLEENLNSKLYLYIDEIFKENNIKIDYNKYLLTYNNNIKNINILKDLSFYLKNITLSQKLFDNKEDFKNYLKLSQYFIIINNSLNITNEQKNIETNLVEFYDFYNTSIKNLRNIYFKDSLSQNWLLVLKDDQKLDDNVKLINEINLNIYNYYKNNQENISDKNKILVYSYEKLKKDFDEYYSALTNYNQYVINYDNTTKKLFDSETIYSQQQNIVLSIDNLNKYLSKFVWVDLNSISAEIKDNNYYNIKSIYINGQSFSFDLYPKRLNLLTNIKWNTVKWLSWSSYELDTIEEKYEQMKNWNQEDKKYDFSYFFLNIFFTNNNSPIIEEYKNNENILKEDKVVTIFKRDRLFWEKWDFSILKPEVLFNYNDVIVEISNNKYDISIKKWIYSNSINIDSTSFNLESEFSWDYKFEWSTHYFKDLSTKLIDKTNSWDYNVQYLFNWNNINIKWIIKTIDFKNQYYKKMNWLLLAKDSYQLISNFLSKNDIDITVLENNNVEFLFEYEKKKVNIIFKGTSLIKFTIDWKDYILNKEVPYNNLIQYLQLIKK